MNLWALAWQSTKQTHIPHRHISTRFACVCVCVGGQPATVKSVISSVGKSC